MFLCSVSAAINSKLDSLSAIDFNLGSEFLSYNNCGEHSSVVKVPPFVSVILLFLLLFCVSGFSVAVTARYFMSTQIACAYILVGLESFLENFYLLIHIYLNFDHPYFGGTGAVHIIMPIKHACSTDVTFRGIPALTREEIVGPLSHVRSDKRNYNNAKRAAAAKVRRERRLRLVRAGGSTRVVREFTTQRTKINNLVLRGDAVKYFRERTNVRGWKSWWHGHECCVRKCATWFTEELDDGSVDVLWNMRTDMQKLRGEKDRNAFLSGVIQRNFVLKKLVTVNYKRLQTEAVYTLAPALLEEKRRVCVNFFCKLLDISTKKYTSVKMHMDLTDVYQNRPKLGFRIKNSAKRQAVVNWIRLTADLHDPLPHRRELRICVATKAMVWEMYMDDVRNGSDLWVKPLPDVAYDYFLRVWAEDIGREITVRGKSTEFARCTFCKSCEEKLANKRLSEGERDIVKQEYYAHHKLQKAERMAYDVRIAEAQRPYSDVLSIAIDGGDQGAFGSPFFKEKTKTNEKWFKMRNYVIGVCIHNPDFPDLLFHHLPIFERGPNVTIEVIHRTLCEVHKTYEARGKSLPRKLYIQLDNCSRENKNQFLIAFLCDLVWKKVFDEICVFYLPVGHTHFDPDALFSKINANVRKQHALCIEELMQRFQTSKLPHPKTFRLHEVASFAQYCKSNEVLERMVGLSTVRGIRVMRYVGRGSNSGKPCVSTRRTSTNTFDDDPWCEPVFPLKERIDYTEIPDCEFKSIQPWKLERIQKGIQQFEVEGPDLLSVEDERFAKAMDSLWQSYRTVRDCTKFVVPFPWDLDSDGYLPYQPSSEYSSEDTMDLHSGDVDVLTSDRLTQPASPINHNKFRGKPTYFYANKRDIPSCTFAAPSPVAPGSFALFRKRGFDEFYRGMNFDNLEYEVGYVEKVFRYRPNKVPPAVAHTMESLAQKCALVRWYEPTPGTARRVFKDRVWKEDKRPCPGTRNLVACRDIQVSSSALIGFDKFQVNGKLFDETLKSVQTLINDSLLAVDDWGAN